MAAMVLTRGLVRDDVLRELVYSGRVVPAEEAVALGLATRTCDDPLATARALAQAVALQNPHAVRAAKRLLNQTVGVVGVVGGVGKTAAAALLQAESDEQTALIGSRNQQEAVRANLEKRSPRFQDCFQDRFRN